MARVCMRPGCDRPAEVRLSYDTITCRVWLDLLPPRPGPVQEICDFHAMRLTMPRGWILSDRRVAAPALFDFDRLAPAPGHRIPEPRSDAQVLEPVDVADADHADHGDHGDHGAAIHEVREPSVPARVAGRPRPMLNASQLFDAPHLVVVEPDPQESEQDPEVEREVADPGGIFGTGEADDADDVLKASSPLLARAFAAAGPQRSVLTDSIFKASESDEESD